METRIPGYISHALKTTVYDLIYDVAINCFISAAFFVQFPLCGY